MTRATRLVACLGGCLAVWALDREGRVDHILLDKEGRDLVHEGEQRGRLGPARRFLGDARET